MDSLKMYCKVVQSGDVVEMYFYKVPIKVGNKRSFDIVKSDSSENKEKRSDNVYRARRNVRRIVWSNQSEYSKFVTLTYAETVLDPKIVKRHITTFVQAMRRLGYDMKYLYVLENQKERGLKENNEGSLHVHMLIFIDKFIKREDLTKCWKHGFVSIEKIDHVNNLGAYVCKYITKETVMCGNRSFFCSVGLERPVDERFYTLNFSDSTTSLTPSQVLDGLNISYSCKLNLDMVDWKSDFFNQSVTYYQGKWKSDNLIEKVGLEDEIERQLDYLASTAF